MARRILAVLMILAMVACFVGTVSAADMETIKGTLTSQDQLQAEDGQQYMLENTQAVDNIDQMVDKMVEVKGTVMEQDGKKVIQVESIMPSE